MNVGEDKGGIVTDLIAEVKSRTMVELGGYVGYSCILFGDAVRKAGGKRYISLERSPEFAAVVASLVDLAGLSDIVKVVVGSSDVYQKIAFFGGTATHRFVVPRSLQACIYNRPEAMRRAEIGHTGFCDGG
jgi:catechol O-methyltransferase